MQRSWTEIFSFYFSTNLKKLILKLRKKIKIKNSCVNAFKILRLNKIAIALDFP